LRDARGSLGANAPELLDPARIAACLDGAPVGLRGLECVTETASTNQDLLLRPAGDVHAIARLAERQTGGRGRRGRSWFSPHARNIYLSLGWRFDAGPTALTFLPLVVAVAVARAVTRLGYRGHGIKWPNDLVTPGGKLGGCLVELRSPSKGGSLAVLGVGLNVRLAGAPGLELLDQPWADLAAELPDVSRNITAGELLRALLEAVSSYERDGLGARGFASFAPDWRHHDRLAGREVSVRGEGQSFDGRCLGLGEQGGLRVEAGGRIVEVHAGEVSVRRLNS
jgi:BirA family biotin operon repressor/biotin-[acetyl-CoA-carboxylase] ligase